MSHHSQKKEPSVPFLFPKAQSKSFLSLLASLLLLSSLLHYPPTVSFKISLSGMVILLNMNKGNLLILGDFSGKVRIAISPDFYSAKYEAILDRFQSAYAVSGDAVLTKPFCLLCKWEKEGCGQLLMLAHPLHVKLLSRDDCDITILDDFIYRSIDGDLVGVVGDAWVLKPDPIPVTEIVTALCRDVEGLESVAIEDYSPCHYGRMIARAARLAVIAEEVHSLKGYLLLPSS
ncbi:hypothetical protein RCOM_0016850 [Ricinus communis]|uniref:Glycosyl hydrolase family 81 N-terminal domain-containing protein n=1 Tax=Ricinus communis TaxID=3988 RepID=B9T6T2_RICCO|nr:hypothetical protein RCOM_0016850 [Ricinus communis]